MCPGHMHRWVCRCQLPCKLTDAGRGLVYLPFPTVLVLHEQALLISAHGRPAYLMRASLLSLVIMPMSVTFHVLPTRLLSSVALCPAGSSVPPSRPWPTGHSKADLQRVPRQLVSPASPCCPAAGLKVCCRAATFGSCAAGRRHGPVGAWLWAAPATV